MIESPPWVRGGKLVLSLIRWRFGSVASRTDYRGARCGLRRESRPPTPTAAVRECFISSRSCRVHRGLRREARPPTPTAAGRECCIPNRSWRAPPWCGVNLIFLLPRRRFGSVASRINHRGAHCGLRRESRPPTPTAAVPECCIPNRSWRAHHGVEGISPSYCHGGDSGILHPEPIIEGPAVV